jgi:hypothetical protein
MIFNPGLFQAPDFFRLYGDGVEENESACLAPIGPGQLSNFHNFRNFIYLYHSHYSNHIYLPKEQKKIRDTEVSLNLIYPKAQ